MPADIAPGTPYTFALESCARPDASATACGSTEFSAPLYRYGHEWHVDGLLMDSLRFSSSLRKRPSPMIFMPTDAAASFGHSIRTI